MCIPEYMRAFNRKLIAEFRARGSAPQGRPLLLLNTTGTRSGRPHTTPLMYMSDGYRLLVVATNNGAPRHPDWYHNLVAYPRVMVEVAGEIYPATAVVIAGAERDRLFAWIAGQFPFLHDHQATTRRRIPIVALERR